MKINIKTPEELKIMAESADILSDVFKATLEKAKAGMKTMDLEKFAMQMILDKGAKPSFTTVENYKYATCMCVNDCVVHGLPSNYVLKNGDILGLDMGVLWKEFHSDASWSIIIGEENNPRSSVPRESQILISENPKQRLLDIGKEALFAAIQEAHVGNHIWDISAKLQEIIEKKGGYHVVHSLTGHGIGRELHEEPFIPGFVAGTRESTPEIKNGMVFAIEAIYVEKSGKIWYGNDDGWTIITQDGGLAGLFEATVAVVDGKPMILTHLV